MGGFPVERPFPIAEVSAQHIEFQAIVKESLSIIFIKEVFLQR